MLKQVGAPLFASRVPVAKAFASPIDVSSQCRNAGSNKFTNYKHRRTQFNINTEKHRYQKAISFKNSLQLPVLSLQENKGAAQDVSRELRAERKNKSKG